MKTELDYKRQIKLAEMFHSLHHKEEMLILANAWDAASAKLFEVSGFPAIATTSSGVSWAYGYKDGEYLPPELVIESTRNIAKSINIPLSVDIEGGYYRDNYTKFAQFIKDIIDAGAVGINLEDGDSKNRKLNELNHQIELIHIVKNISKEKGINLFLNARTDVMDFANGDINNKIQVGIERANAFQAAGADGIFIPFIMDIATIIKFKDAISLPLNILINNNLEVSKLKEIRVNRVSVGGKPMMATLNLLKKIAQELQQSNDWKSLFVNEPTYYEINSWFEK